MHGPETFDLATRERISQKLLHYKQSHGIGVHRLEARISATHPRNPDISIKTLQRFLGGTLRINDQYMGYLSLFAESLPELDPVGELGLAMAAMFGASGKSPSPPPYAGTYAVSLDLDEESGVARLEWDKTFWRFHETMKVGGHLVYDGVMVHARNALHVLLKDRLLGRAKVYTLRELEEKITRPQQYLLGETNEDLEGHGSHLDFRSGPSSLAVRLIRRSHG